jgi:hypothetical protein
LVKVPDEEEHIEGLAVVAVCQAQLKANLCYQQIKLKTLVTLSFFDCDV